MAKPEKAITIKIDGKKHSFQEERKKTTDRQLNIANEAKQDIQGKSGQLHVYNENNNSSLRAEEEIFQWVLPDQQVEPSMDRVTTTKVEDVRPKSKKSGASTSFGRRTNQKWSSVLFIVLLAIVVGTGFGVMIKKFIIHDEAIEQVMSPNNQAAVPNKNEEQTIANAQESLVIPAQSLYVIQGGVFSTREGAKQYIDELASKEISAGMIDRAGQTIVYLAVADSLAHAKEIGEKFKGNGVDVYAKQLEINEKTFTQITEADQLLLKEAIPLFNQMTLNSTALLLGNTLPDGWKGAQADRIESIIELDVKDEKITHLKNELLAVNSKLQASGDTISEVQFSQLQTHLLTFIELYESP